MHGSHYQSTSHLNYPELNCAILTGIVKVGIIQPFDFLRFRIQSNLDNRVKMKSLIKSFVSKEGVNIFFKGLNATSLGVFFSSLGHFTLYQKFYRIFTKGLFEEHISHNVGNNLDIFRVMEIEKIYHYWHLGYEHSEYLQTDRYKNQLIRRISFVCALAGLFSGIGLAIITTPIDNIRIKLQSTQNIKTEHFKHPTNTLKKTYHNEGMIDCARNIYNHYGLRGFYISFPMSLMRETIASTIYFGSFEYMKNREKIKMNRKKIKILNSFIYGAISGGINWLITLPIDTVKTQMISDTIGGERRFKSVSDCIKTIYNDYGFKGFYKSFSVVFLRGMIVNGAVLTSFDLCRSKYVQNN
jgi:hypothetical protein